MSHIKLLLMLLLLLAQLTRAMGCTPLGAVEASAPKTGPMAGADGRQETQAKGLTVGSAGVQAAGGWQAADAASLSACVQNNVMDMCFSKTKNVCRSVCWHARGTRIVGRPDDMNAVGNVLVEGAIRGDDNWKGNDSSSPLRGNMHPRLERVT